VDITLKFSTGLPILTLNGNKPTKKVSMTTYKLNWNTPPDTLTSDLTAFCVLFLSFIRFTVEKYGGTMETDPATGTTYVGIPDWAKDACMQELADLAEPGNQLTRH